jgi:predicted aspartyl protease
MSPAAFAASASPTRPCQLQEIASLDLTIAPSGGYISVPGDIDGRSGNFLVDTGGFTEVLSESVASEIGIPSKRGNGWMGVFGGIRLTHYVVAQKFKLGNLVGERRTFILAPQSAFPSDVIGMIGPATLTNYDVEFDFANAKMNLFRPGDCSDHAIYWTHDPAAAVTIDVNESRHMTIPVSMNGRTIKATIDTGAGRSAMDIASAAYLLGVDEDDPQFKSKGNLVINGKSGMEGYKVKFPPLTFEGIAVTNPDIEVFDNAHMDTDGHWMILGMDVLRNLHMYIAYQKRLLFLTGAEAH